MNTSQKYYSERDSWFWNETLISKAGATYRYFLKFFETNNHLENVCYLIRLKNSNVPNNKGIQIDVFDEGDKVGEDFRHANRLQLPKSVTVNFNEIQFRIDISKEDAPHYKNKKLIGTTHI